METKNKIQEALDRINRHDWFWRMEDYGYLENYNAAKAGMKSFVKFVNTIEDASIREMLRSLWTLRYEAARAAINGRDESEYTAKQVEIKNALALAA